MVAKQTVTRKVDVEIFLHLAAGDMKFDRHLGDPVFDESGRRAADRPRENCLDEGPQARLVFIEPADESPECDGRHG